MSVSVIKNLLSLLLVIESCLGIKEYLKYAYFKKVLYETIDNTCYNSSFDTLDKCYELRFFSNPNRALDFPYACPFFYYFCQNFSQKY